MDPQSQFLEVIDRDRAQSRFESAISTHPLGEQTVPLTEALGRVLSRDVIAKVNVPSFDRSNLDGFAVRAADTFGAEEHEPLVLELIPEQIAAGSAPQHEIGPGYAMAIATGGMIPRGADAIVMVEHTRAARNQLFVSKPVTPGAGIAFAGTDLSTGEVVLRQGDLLTSRETGILAAIGDVEASVWRRVRVAVISTGNEIIAPGETMQPGQVYDSNARIITDAVRELGGEPLELGIAVDDLAQLRKKVNEALAVADMVLLSGGTSKGQGDLSYRVVQDFDDPGIIVHGVALKPGKPICLGATQGKPLVILPGFPTSAIFTFHEFVAPVISRMSGLPPVSRSAQQAELAVKVNSEIGRTEYLLVGLVRNQNKNSENQRPALAAFPIGKGSGSVTTFSQADGFVTIDRHEELVEAGTQVQVQLLSRDLRLADLVIIGSHCTGLDFIMGQLQSRGVKTKFFAVGSSAGLAAVKRGQCDIAGMHLFDAKTQTYNETFIVDALTLIRGYRRKQGLFFRTGDERFEGDDVRHIISQVKDDSSCLMINRNQGSGTRILIDQLLKGSQPNGYAIQTKNHKAVIAAIRQRRVDWGIAIESSGSGDDLTFLPLVDEHYDFVVATRALQKKPVQMFIELLKEDWLVEKLSAMSIETSAEIGSLVPE